MYLLKNSSRQSDSFALFNSFENAKAEARKFVGEHYPVDSCSTEPRAFENKDRTIFSIRRSSSFGERIAIVCVIDEPKD